jgi:hypothetical protein
MGIPHRSRGRRTADNRREYLGRSELGAIRRVDHLGSRKLCDAGIGGAEPS